MRRIAITTGISLLIMAIVGGFSFGYVYPEFNQIDQSEFTYDNMLNNKELYKNMLLGILIILILDLLVSYTLFRYFEKDNRRLSLISAIIRIIYTIIFAIATLYLVRNLTDFEVTNQSIVANFQNFEFAWNVGLMIFGLHIILIGFLMKLHNRIPKFLYYLTLIGGISYVLVHLLKLNSPSQFVSNLEIALALPMAFGEIGLAIWLLVKGGKDI